MVGDTPYLLVAVYSLVELKPKEVKMAIKSNAFGRVVLSGRDAKKFAAQVTYGKPKQAAKVNAKRGSEMLREMRAKASARARTR